jgi:acyl-CoA synthetase (AMP-forming)/AMP-acid ligase II
MRPPSPIAEAFAAVLRDRADEVLLVAPTEQRTCTARHVDAAAHDLAAALRAAAGLTRGHLIVSSIGNVAAMPPLVLACLREGLPLMPVDRSAPTGELRTLAATWRAAAVIVPAAQDLDADLDDGDQAQRRRRVALPNGLAAYVGTRLPEPGAHAPAAVLKLTSGSTGTPRATCTEERHLVADVAQIVDAMGIGPSDRQLGVIPLSHSYGFSNLLLPLLWQGTPLWLRPQFVPTQIASDVQSAGLRTFAGVPFMFEHLARHQPSPVLGSLRLVLSAGARLPYETVASFHRVSGVKIRSFYGSSETGGICFDDSDQLDARVPVGRPMGNAVVTLIEDGQAPSGSGRVQVQGPNVIDRYMRAPATDDAAMAVAEPAAATSGFVAPGTFVTGDYASRDDAGVYVLTGRVASFVNVAGRKVHPEEVEAALRRLPGVSDAVALAIDDPVRGQALAACLVSARPWDARTVREALSARLAAWKLPRVVIVVPNLPLTDRGKVDRIAIARRLGDA